MPRIASLLRKNLIVLFLVLAVYAWYFATHELQNLKSTNVITAGSNITLFVEPANGKSPIINEINAAQKEVLIEVYLLSDKDTIAALEQAKDRGVKVMVMMEQHPFGGGNNSKTKTELESKGVLVEWASSEFSLTHEKTIVIDDREVFILNQNLTASAFSKNREYDILDQNPQDVTQVRQVFENDWQRKTYNIQTDTSLILSPLNSRKVLSALITKSNKSLDIEIEDINDSSVLNLIAQEAKNEKVRMLIPSLSQISSNQIAVDNLKSNNIQIKYLTSPYIHAKLIVSDSNTAYVGSVNLSSQSMDQNRELGIIISNPEIINTLEKTFNTDWDKAKVVN